MQGGYAALGMAIHCPQLLAGTPTVYLCHLLPPPSSHFIVLPLCLHCLTPVIVISPCHCCLPLSLSPPSLSIPIGGDMAVSTCSTLWVNAHSGGGQVLGHCHFCCLLPTLSLTTHPPCKLGLVAVVVSGLWQWCGVVLSLVPFHLWSTPWAVACEAGGSWLVILVSRHYPMPL